METSNIEELTKRYENTILEHIQRSGELSLHSYAIGYLDGIIRGSGSDTDAERIKIATAFLKALDNTEAKLKRRY